jgi:hypothetical protein
MLAPTFTLHDPDVLFALRELFSKHPVMTQNGCEDLSRALFELHYLPSRPETFQVEAALEALHVEGEVFG